MTRNETFFTAVGCMDGRVQGPIAQLGRDRFGAQYPDTITEAGLVGKLIAPDKELLSTLGFKVVTVSVEKHNSKGVIVHGHQECAGNPIEDERHIADVKRTGEVVRSMLEDAGSTIPVLDVFVYREGDSWMTREV